MLKTLIKKQLLEINKSFFVSKKTGERFTTGKKIGYISLFSMLMIFVAFIFVEPAIMMCAAFKEANIMWLYFTMMGGLAIVFGAFGSIFNTYSSLYQAKDNDALLSMPIPVKYILITRLIGVYFMGLLYSSVVLIPTLIVYFLYGNPSILSIFTSIILYFLITIFVLILSCLLGYVVAKISAKLKNKSLVIVVASLLFIVVYYYCYYEINNLITKLVSDSASTAKIIKSYIYPFYAMGMMGTGDLLSSLIFILIVIGLFLIEYLILSHSFIKIVTTKDTKTKQAKKSFKFKENNKHLALLKKEIKHFLSSPIYMLNCGIGSIFMLIMGGYIILKGNSLDDIIAKIEFKDGEFLILTFATVFLAMANDITSPSISLEGKNLWILKTLPINSWDIFKAKIGLHLVVTLPGVLFVCFCTIISFGLNFIQSLLMILVGITCVLLSAVFGLFINLKMPLLNWNSEVIPVKQSIGVVIVLFAGWIYVIAAAAIYILMSDYINSTIFVVLFILFTVIINIIILVYLKKKGTKIFDEL